jgi:hypothetical protein
VSPNFSSPLAGFQRPELLDPGPAALDQNHQNNHKQNCANDPDNVGAVHLEPLSYKSQLKAATVKATFPGGS